MSLFCRLSKGVHPVRTRVKICGITNVEDALTAVAAGADAIGLVFYASSPRAVSIEQAANIVRQLPAFVTTVALFVNASADYVQSVISQVEINLLQFHGDESPAYCASFNCRYIKAIRVKQDTNLIQYANDFANASGLLLDAFVEGVPGGTGQVFDWQLMPQNLPLPVILAGGLNADNIKQAIADVNPYAVDVSGGVEAMKGIKDASKIGAFMQLVNQS